MGALRINKVDGTSEFIDLSGFSSASLQTIGDESTITLTPIDPGLGNTVVTISRFRTQPQDSVWVYSSDGAYQAISRIPIEYGYPQLGSNVNTYREYDASKIAINAIQAALGSSSSDEIVYSEITAIAENIGSIDDLKQLLDTLDAIESEALNIEAETIAECFAATESGNTFNSECGGSCEPLPGPAPNAPCCEAAGEACKKAELLKILDATGPISKKHQYLFEDVTVTSGPV